MAPLKSRKPRLKSGRPPSAKAHAQTLSSKATQKTIATFHRLHKALATAQSRPHSADISRIEAQMAELGGLRRYQAASAQGQCASRGGDSSAVLMEWLAPLRTSIRRGAHAKLRLLEIGALATRNACSTGGCFERVERIDLHARHAGIRRQDFMLRPLPGAAAAAAAGEEEEEEEEEDEDEGEAERFDVISLSLVLNFVPTPAGRGEMLRRTTHFLRPPRPRPSSSAAPLAWGAMLFLVLPAPCVLNSRYLHEERLCHIMASLGYVMVQRKQSRKLVYWLWQLRDRPAEEESEQAFGKVKVRDGPGMNNFWIEMRPPAGKV